MHLRESSFAGGITAPGGEGLYSSPQVPEDPRAIAGKIESLARQLPASEPLT